MSVFGVILVRISRIRAEYREIRRISPYSDRIREITDQINSEYGHFLRGVNANIYMPKTFFKLEVCTLSIYFKGKSIEFDWYNSYRYPSLGYVFKIAA